MLGKNAHAVIYLTGLMGLAISLPLSVFTTSVFLFVLVVNWLLEGLFPAKFQRILNRKSLWLILSVYLVFVLGLIFTNDFRYAFHDLKIKLPLLVLPLVIGTSPPLSRKHLKFVLLSLVAGVLIGSLASSSVLFGLIEYTYSDTREISLFINHIRFALLIDIAIFSLFYLIFQGEYEDPPWLRASYGLVLVWLVIFLFLLQSITGIVIFLGTGFILFLIYRKSIGHVALRVAMAVLVIGGSMMAVYSLAGTVEKYYRVKEFNPDMVDLRTVNGNSYTHDFSSPFVENGSYIWLYVCEKELEKEWNRISSIDYQGRDQSGHEIRYTLIRYLTSLGLRKDSVGVSRLLPSDVELIEQGKPSHLYGKRFKFSAKLNEVFWQIDVYRKGGNPSGHSVTQRIHYLQAAWNIFKKHIWTGVGTGDVIVTYKSYYEQIDSPLEERWRLRAHNQFLTFLLTYGIFGFTWILFALIYPVFLEKKCGNYFMIVILLVGFLSFLNEDTLETHTGVSFFAFFYALFLLGTESEPEIQS